MAEIMEEKKELTPAETAAPASPETPAKKPEKSTADKKKRRRITVHFADNGGEENES
jgi:hypothetical protein